MGALGGNHHGNGYVLNIKQGDLSDQCLDYGDSGHAHYGRQPETGTLTS